MLSLCEVVLKRDEYDAIQAALHDAIRSCYELGTGAEDENVVKMMERYKDALLRARLAMNVAYWHKDEEVKA